MAKLPSIEDWLGAFSGGVSPQTARRFTHALTMPARREATTTTLTPELARRLLSTLGPVAVFPEKIEEIAAAIRAGTFPAGTTILCSRYSGTMLDGQHRCRAVLETGIPITVSLEINWPGLPGRA